jgi:hypothetical protein
VQEYIWQAILRDGGGGVVASGIRELGKTHAVEATHTEPVGLAWLQDLHLQAQYPIGEQNIMKASVLVRYHIENQN